MLQKLKTSVEEANAEKIAAQQSLHELQLKMRELKARRLSPRESRGPENTSVLKKILTMEDKSQGLHPLSLMVKTYPTAVEGLSLILCTVRWIWGMSEHINLV